VSESAEFTPQPEEIISTPGADVLVPSPADIQLNGAVQVSERQQARRENWRLIRRRPAFLIGVFIVIVWTVCAIFGNQIAPHNALDFRAIPHLHPGGSYLFGTDNQGRDVLSRVIVGGLLDNVLSRIVESFLALPVLLVALLAITTLGNGTWVVIGVIAALFTPIVARTVRSAVIAERDLDYVTSAKLRGETSLFVMFKEILPNVSGPIIVELTVRIGYAVFTVATLSFLGAGPKPPSPDWGVQVSDGFRVISAGIWWTTFFPAAAIASLVIAVNLIADSVQSVLEAS
jgi:peptide/nickel transport system permease protein